MEIRTRQMNANVAAAGWKESYENTKYWLQDERWRIWEKLVELGSTPKPDEVDATIGNDSWTWLGLTCSECDKRHEVAVEFQDSEGHTFDICLPCLLLAAALATKAPSTKGVPLSKLVEMTEDTGMASIYLSKFPEQALHDISLMHNMHMAMSLIDSIMKSERITADDKLTHIEKIIRGYA